MNECYINTSRERGAAIACTENLMCSGACASIMYILLSGSGGAQWKEVSDREREREREKERGDKVESFPLHCSLLPIVFAHQLACTIAHCTVQYWLFVLPI